MTRVLVASASPIVRAGLRSVISASSALEVAGVSHGPTDMAQQIEELHPDVVLLEPAEDDPAEALLALGEDTHHSAIVVLSDGWSNYLTPEALSSGVRAVLPREASAEEIVAAIEAVAAGLVVLRPDSVDSLLSGLPTTGRPIPAAPAATGEALAPREIEVLGMIAEGLGNKTIAWRLGISEHTVKFHIGSIFNKLNASSRTEAVTIGIRQGLIML